MARNVPAGYARPRAAILQEDDNQGPPQQAQRNNNNGNAGGSWARISLLMVILGIVILPPIVYYTAQYCSSATTPVPALITVCSWLTLLSPQEWVTVRKVFWIAMIALLAVMKGVSEWRNGSTPLSIAAAVIYLLLQDSFWYDLRFG